VLFITFITQRTVDGGNEPRGGRTGAAAGAPQLEAASHPAASFPMSCTGCRPQSWGFDDLRRTRLL